MRYVTLKRDEIEALESHCISSNHTIRKRSQCLLLSDQGWTIIDLASICITKCRYKIRHYILTITKKLFKFLH